VDHRCSQWQETHIDAPSLCPDAVVQRTQHHGEGEHLVLGVFEDLFEVPALHTAKGDARAGRPVEGIECVLNLGAERHEPRVPAELHALPEELLGHAVAVHIAAHECQNVLLLKVPGDLESLLVAVRRADDADITRHGAVHKLHAQVAEDSVGDEAIVGKTDRIILHRLLPIDVSDRHDDLLGKECRHTCVERLAQIGLIEMVFRRVRQERLYLLLKGRLHVAHGADLEARHGEQLRQEVSRIGELEREIRTLLRNGLFDKRLGLFDIVVGTENGPGGNDF
jgi:hypothetical protein